MKKRFCVVAPDGTPVEAAVVVGGGNWTPSNADGTFWLDNVFPGPLRLDLFHHAWRRATFLDVATDGGDFMIWKSQTTDTSGVYNGEAGHTYEFLALATDNAGNKELPPVGIAAPDDGGGARARP